MDDTVTAGEVLEWLNACKPVPQSAYAVEVVAAIHANQHATAEHLGSYLVARALTFPASNELEINSDEVLERTRSIHAQVIKTHGKSDGEHVEKWLRCFLHEQAFGLALSSSITSLWQEKQRFETAPVPSFAAGQKEYDADSFGYQVGKCLLAACSFCHYHEDVRNLFRVLVDSGEVLQLVAAERPRTPKSHGRKRRRSGSALDGDSVSPSAESTQPAGKSARRSETADGGAASPPARGNRPVDSVQLSQPAPDMDCFQTPFAEAVAPPQLVKGEYNAYVEAVKQTYTGVRSCRQVCFLWCNVYEAFLAALQAVCAAHEAAQQQSAALVKDVVPELQSQLAEAEEGLQSSLQAVHAAAAQVAAGETQEQSSDVIDLSGSQSPVHDHVSAAALPGDVQAHLLLLAEALGDDTRDPTTLAAARAAMEKHKQAKQVKANIKAQMKSCARQQAYMSALGQFCLALLHSLTTHRDYLRRVLASCMDAAVRFTNDQLHDSLNAMGAYCSGEMRRSRRMQEDQAAALAQLQGHDEVYGAGTSTKRDVLQTVVIEVGQAREALEAHVRDATEPLVQLVHSMRQACPAATCEQWSSQLDTFAQAFIQEHQCGEEFSGGTGVMRVVAQALQDSLLALRDQGTSAGVDARIAAFPSVQLAPHVPLHRHPSEASVQTPEAPGHPGFSPRTPMPSAPPPGQDAAPGDSDSHLAGEADDDTAVPVGQEEHDAEEHDDAEQEEGADSLQGDADAEEPGVQEESSSGCCLM